MESNIIPNKNPEFRKVQGIVGDSSFSIVLPKLFALHLGISKGEFLKVTCEDQRILIEKVK